jgi:hypothetical protein
LAPIETLGRTAGAPAVPVAACGGRAAGAAGTGDASAAAGPLMIAPQAMVAMAAARRNLGTPDTPTPILLFAMCIATDRTVPDYASWA